ncbi:MAG: Ppx/GppA family phosphatase [bacterium]|nr:Ppx/GppA family phosphatase [bacterium]MDD6765917.1 Ppx/GppA family phosphatase [bacterium]MDD6837540.1 Ppx/GppA family phosphatase [bacterium]MDY6005298.1 Ppx/GppA family phosphatase [Parabacteroides sp.]
MGKVKYAAIDIGSNAARLLIKSIDREAEDRKRFKKLLLLRVPLRLGFDVFENGELSEKKSKQLLRLMKAFRQLMKIYDVDRFRACATSAMRDARNGQSVIREIQRETSIPIEIISGQEEARMIYENHVECLEDRTGNYMYVDVGGGSTEINLLVDGNLQFSASYNVGTIRMLNRAVRPEVWEKLEQQLTELTADLQDLHIIGSGGNINKLFRLSKQREQQSSLSLESLQLLYDELAPLTPDERMEAFHLKQDRADVIVPAAEIFLKIGKVTRAVDIIVPVIGLADGIIDNLYLENLGR